MEWRAKLLWAWESCASARGFQRHHWGAATWPDGWRVASCPCGMCVGLLTLPRMPIFRARVVFACPIFLQNLFIFCSSNRVVDGPSPYCSPCPLLQSYCLSSYPHRSATCRHIPELSRKFSKFSERRWEVTHGIGPTRENLALESADRCLLSRARVEML